MRSVDIPVHYLMQWERRFVPASLSRFIGGADRNVRSPYGAIQALFWRLSDGKTCRCAMASGIRRKLLL